MIAPWMLISFGSVMALVMIGMLVLACMEEARHRQSAKDSTVEAMLTALRIHEAAQEARVLMASEIRRLADGAE
jgi:hypothetical protein